MTENVRKLRSRNIDLSGVQEISSEVYSQSSEKKRKYTKKANKKESKTAQQIISEEPKINDKSPAIGIDLGTTYSCVGIFRNGQVEIIPNEQGNRTMPSWVAFTETEKLVGEGAKNQAARNPQNTVYDAKRLIGRPFSDECIQEDIKNWPFTVVGDEQDRPRIRVNFKEKECDFLPEEISAMVLGKLKQISEDYLGEEVTRAVITVPAYFNDAQRQATKDAAKIAGLEVLRIINEPTAAALAYGLAQNNKAEKRIVVFDTGGGTHDISVLTLDDDVFQVKATGGNTHLGGQDFDLRMLEFLISEFKRKHKKVDIRKYPRAIKRLLLECERAKRTLSSSTIAAIELDALCEGIDFYTTISRAKFEDLCSDLFRKCMGPLENVLADARIPREKIDEIVLIGGSTRIPKIQQLLSSFFEGRELCKSINPDEAVAYGAAVQAAILTGVRDEKIDDVLLVDVIPLSVGVEVHGNLMNVMIPRNTSIPAKRTEIFSTFSDDQQVVTIKVYEGERMLTKDNHLLGAFHLSGIPKLPRGAPQIQVTFEVDADGILKVLAWNKDSDKKESLTVRNDTGRLSKDEIEKMVQDAQQYKKEDEEEAERIEARNELEDYLYQVSSARLEDDEFHKFLDEIYDWLEENGETASKEDFQEKMADIEDHLVPDEEIEPDDVVEEGGTNLEIDFDAEEAREV